MTLTDITLFIPTASLQKKTSKLSMSEKNDRYNNYLQVHCAVQSCYFFRHIQLFFLFLLALFTLKMMRDILNSPCLDSTGNKYGSSFSPKSKNKTNYKKVQIKK